MVGHLNGGWSLEGGLIQQVDAPESVSCLVLFHDDCLAGPR